MFGVILLNMVIVTLVVIIHYESLYRLTRLMPQLKIQHRYNIVIGLIGALLAHLLEVMIFAIAYYLLHRQEGWGELRGVAEDTFAGSFADCIYFSFTTYSTLGFGDIQPHGDLRYLVGIESLTGLVLITWSASFLYIEMQEYWRAGKH